MPCLPWKDRRQCFRKYRTPGKAHVSPVHMMWHCILAASALSVRDRCPRTVACNQIIAYRSDLSGHVQIYTDEWGKWHIRSNFRLAFYSDLPTFKTALASFLRPGFIAMISLKKKTHKSAKFETHNLFLSSFSHWHVWVKGISSKRITLKIDVVGPENKRFAGAAFVPRHSARKSYRLEQWRG